MGDFETNFSINIRTFATIIFMMLALSFFLFISGVFNSKPLSASFRSEVVILELKNEVIDSKFKDKHNHGVISYSFKESNIILSSLPSKWHQLMEKGDTINKKKMSLIFELKKLDGRKFSLDYQECLDQIDKDGYLE